MIMGPQEEPSYWIYQDEKFKQIYALFWERSFASAGILLWKKDIYDKISLCSEISKRKRNRRERNRNGQRRVREKYITTFSSLLDDLLVKKDCSSLKEELAFVDRHQF